MKKLVILLLCLASFLLLASCKGDPDASAEKAYGNILSAYAELLEDKANEATSAAPKKLSEDIAAVIVYAVENCTDVKAMGYSIKDINSDGVCELFLMDKGQRIYGLFTLKENKPTLLLSGENTTITVSADGTIYSSKYVKDVCSYTRVDQIVDGHLDGFEFGYGGVVDGTLVDYYKTEKGITSEITFQEFNSLSESLRHRFMSVKKNNKNAGLWFVPSLKNDSAQSDAPVADFSTYDSVLDMYKKIVEFYPEYNELEWTQGTYDTAYTFRDSGNYEIYNTVFYRGIANKPTKAYFGQEYALDGNNAYGYAKKDLNGDGIEELVLLTDKYEVFAVFTMKNGKAKLLNCVTDPCIDQDGKFRMSVSTGGIVSRDGEYYLYEINDGELKCVSGVGFKVNIYLEKEGWYKTDGKTQTSISAEEGNALYESYGKLTEFYTAEEYNKAFSGLEFIPLFEKTTAVKTHREAFYRNANSSGCRLTVNDFDADSVEFEFYYTYSKHDIETLTLLDSYETTFSTKARFDGSVYTFEHEGTKGYLDFGVNCVWLVIIEGADERILNKPYLFDYYK